MTETTSNSHETAVLGARVSNVESAVGGLKKDVADLSHTMTISHQAMMSEMSKLGTSIVASRNPNWLTLLSIASLSIAVIGACATLAKAPIDEHLTRLDADTHELRAEIVPRSEHEQRWAVTSSEIARLRGRVDNIQHDLYKPEIQK